MTKHSKGYKARKKAEKNEGREGVIAAANEMLRGPPLVINTVDFSQLEVTGLQRKHVHQKMVTFIHARGLTLEMFHYNDDKLPSAKWVNGRKEANTATGDAVVQQGLATDDDQAEFQQGLGEASAMVHPDPAIGDSSAMVQQGQASGEASAEVQPHLAVDANSCSQSMELEVGTLRRVLRSERELDNLNSNNITDLWMLYNSA